MVRVTRTVIANVPKGRFCGKCSAASFYLTESRGVCSLFNEPLESEHYWNSKRNIVYRYYKCKQCKNFVSNDMHDPDITVDVDFPNNPTHGEKG